MAYSAQQRERWKAEAVENISNDAQRYFMMVWNPDATNSLPPGPRLLRAVFTLRDPNLQLSLSRARVIPMTALSLSFAEKMRKMIDVSDVESQFVCWATIENEFERVVDHTMFIVDIHLNRGGEGDGGLVWEGTFHSPDDMQESPVVPVQPQLAPAPSPKQQQQQHPPAVPPPDTAAVSAISAPSPKAAAIVRPQTLPNGMPATAAALWGIPQQAQQQQQQQSIPTGGINSEQVSEVMEIALLTSRAAAKIVASVSESQARIDHLIEQTMPLTQQHMPIHQLGQIVQLLAQMETRLKLIEEQQMLTLEAAQVVELPPPPPPRPLQRSISVQCSVTPASLRSVSAQTDEPDLARLSIADQEEYFGTRDRSTSRTSTASKSAGRSPLRQDATGHSTPQGSAGIQQQPARPMITRQENSTVPKDGDDNDDEVDVMYSSRRPQYVGPSQVLVDDDADPRARRLASYRSSTSRQLPATVSPAPLREPKAAIVTIPAKDDPVVAGPAAATSKFRVRKVPSTSSIAGPTSPLT